MSNFLLYDSIIREEGDPKFTISNNLNYQLLSISFEKILLFIKENNLSNVDDNFDKEKIINNFQSSLLEAYRNNLFNIGGIPEKNFLSLFFIFSILKPSLYVEVGFFKGCSLFCAYSSNSIKKIIAFDPNHENLKYKFPPECDIELNQIDFSEYNFQNLEKSSSLIFFDDHINTAKRIIESKDKGFKNRIFDDSHGLMGTCERFYPAMPSLFFISNIKKFSIGDHFSWSMPIEKNKFSQLTFKFNKEIYELCLKANSFIDKIYKIPDLNDYIFTPRKSKVIDNSQYFVKLI